MKKKDRRKVKRGAGLPSSLLTYTKTDRDSAAEPHKLTRYLRRFNAKEKGGEANMDEEKKAMPVQGDKDGDDKTESEQPSSEESADGDE